MEEDDMVMRAGSSLIQRDALMRKGWDIRRCQGLAEGWPWQPPKDLLHIPYRRVVRESPVPCSYITIYLGST